MKPKYRYFVVDISSGANGAPIVLTQPRLRHWARVELPCLGQADAAGDRETKHAGHEAHELMDIDRISQREPRGELVTKLFRVGKWRPR